MEIKFSMFLNFFDVISIFFRCFFSMFSLLIFCLSVFLLFYVLSFYVSSWTQAEGAVLFYAYKELITVFIVFFLIITVIILFFSGFSFDSKAGVPDSYFWADTPIVGEMGQIISEMGTGEMGINRYGMSCFNPF